MKNNISAFEISISDIFSEKFIFNIPPYQRPYSWSKEEAKTLFDDIMECVQDAPDDIEKGSQYFLGSVVLIKNEGSTEYDVVDGQQRLTTLTILLSCLRESLSNEYKTHIEKHIYDDENPLIGIKKSFRVNLREREREFFRNNVQVKDFLSNLESLNFNALSDAKKLLGENTKLYLDLLSGFDDKLVLKITQFILQKCTLVVVSSDDADSAYKIFSIMNDRGKDLTNSDILKAEIIGAIKNETSQLEYTKKWEDVEDSLGRERFENLFSHIRMISLKIKPKEAILKEYRAKIKPTEKPEEFIDGTIIKYSQCLDIIHNQNFCGGTDAEKINYYLFWLSKIDNKDWVPIALVLLGKYQNDHSKLRNYLFYLERLAAGYMILRKDITKRFEIYGKVLQSLELDKELNKESPLMLSQSEQNEIVMILNGPIYNSSKIRLNVLLRLDTVLSSGGASYDNKKTTIEHVLPQNPNESSEWQEIWPNEEVRKNYVHKLGNLVILDKAKNSSANNYDFPKKKKSYFVRNGVSPFQITTTVLNEPKWTQEVVERRQAEFIQKLCDEWDVSSDVPYSLNLNRVPFVYDMNEDCWKSNNDKSFGIYLVNGCEVVALKDWDGEDIVIDCEEFKFVKEQILQNKFFSSVKTVIEFPREIKIKDQTFSRAKDKMIWNSNGSRISLFWKGRRQRKWLGVWDEIQIEDDNADKIRSKLLNLDFFTTFFDSMKPKLDEKESLKLVGEFDSKERRNGVSFYKLRSGETFSLKNSQFYKEDNSYWYGISPKTLEKYREVDINYLLLTVGGDGVIKLPVETLEDYLRIANVTKLEDGNIKHYHLFIKRERGRFYLYKNMESAKSEITSFFVEYED